MANHKQYHGEAITHEAETEKKERTKVSGKVTARDDATFYSLSNAKIPLVLKEERNRKGRASVSRPPPSARSQQVG